MLIRRISRHEEKAVFGRAGHLALLLDEALVALTINNCCRLTDKGHDYLENLDATSKSGPTPVG